MSCKININEIDPGVLSKLKSKAVLKIENNGKPDNVILTRLINETAIFHFQWLRILTFLFLFGINFPLFLQNLREN